MHKHSLEKIIANIIINFVLKHAKKKQCQVVNLGIPPENISDLAWMIKLNIVDMTKASIIFDEMVVTHKLPSIIACDMDLLPKKEDRDQVEKWTRQVLDDNSKVVHDIKSGKEKAYGFIIGKVMKLSKGKADAKIIKEIIKRVIK